MDAQEILGSSTRRMTDRIAPAGNSRPGRWVLVAVLILLGIGLYFWFAPRTQPPAPPAEQEAP